MGLSVWLFTVFTIFIDDLCIEMITGEGHILAKKILDIQIESDLKCELWLIVE